MKHYVLVAGFDYIRAFDPRLTPAPYRTFCERRAQQLIRENGGGEDVTVWIFDFRTGEVLKEDGPFGPKGPEWKTPIERRKAPSSAHYEQGVGEYPGLKTGVKGFLSILNVYDTIRSVPPGSLRELSFFSHGFPGGPVLLNSFARYAHHPAYEHLRRDPNDFDPREYDFRYMSAGDRERIRQSFHKDAVIWVWGCSEDKRFNPVARKIEHAVRGTTQPERVVSISFSTADRKWLIDHFDLHYERLHPGGSVSLRIKGALNAVGPVRLRLSDLLWVYCRDLESTYFPRVAADLDVPVIGPPPGAGSWQDTSIVKRYGARHVRNPRLMGVPPKAIFRRRLAFLERRFGLAEDPYGRGYVQYAPGLGCPSL